MKTINELSNDPLQEQTVVLDDGTSFTFTLRFIPMQYGWFIDELNYNQGEFILQGVRVCNSPNILRQFVNKIPFGISCITEGNREPSFIDDFSSGASSLYILSESETTQFEEFLRGQ